MASSLSRSCSWFCFLPWAAPARSSSSSSSSTLFDWDCARVIHQSGFMEDFEEGVRVKEVLGRMNRKSFVLCTSLRLLSPGSSPPLRLGDHLEKGRLYFLLPRSSLDTASPSDLATLVANHTAIAVRGRKNIGDSRRRPLSKRVRPVLVELGNGSTAAGTHLMHSRMRRRARRRYWKPTLETIHEDL